MSFFNVSLQTSGGEPRPLAMCEVDESDGYPHNLPMGAQLTPTDELQKKKRPCLRDKGN